MSQIEDLKVLMQRENINEMFVRLLFLKKKKKII